MFDAFDSVEVSTALNAPSEGRLRFGDDGAWQRFESACAPGATYAITINGNPLLKGRVEVSDLSGSTSGGVDFNVIIRTRLGDARYSSARPTLKVENVSLKEFLISLFEDVGLREADFLFSDATNRELLTGKASGSKPVELEPIQVSAAKVQPPETIWECAKRHLERHGLMLWEGVDGTVCVGTPNDQQPPIYRLVCKRPDQGANNVQSFRRVRDYTDVAAEVSVFGFSPGKDFTKVPIAARAVDQHVSDLFAATGHFGRFITLPMERAKSADLANKQAARELSMRRRKIDAWEIVTDGWNYWSGDGGVAWTFNAVADVDIDVAGGPAGPYLITRVSQTMSVDSSLTTTLALIAPGLWVLE